MKKKGGGKGQPEIRVTTTGPGSIFVHIQASSLFRVTSCVAKVYLFYKRKQEVRLTLTRNIIVSKNSATIFQKLPDIKEKAQSSCNDNLSTVINFRRMKPDIKFQLLEMVNFAKN